MDKNAIKKYAVWARNELIARVSQKAQQYGISAEGYGDRNADSVNGVLLSATEKKQRQALIAKIDAEGFEQVMEEVAYTWFNRFTALRFMEVNNYLPSHTRVFTNEANEFKPQILADAISLEIEGLDMDKVFELKNANKDEELYKYLLIVQCNALSSILPGMFQKIADYTELLLPDYLLREGSVIEQMISLIPESDWTEQVQIIGWLYQYYNIEPKAAVFAKAKNKKIAKEEIPAATQLFTPDWIVRYLVENSLGKLWIEGHDNQDLLASWKYYVKRADSEIDASDKYKIVVQNNQNLKPEDILCIDPCSGSGHILSYIFDVLVQIYEAYGYSSREAAVSIIENNIYGLDIDDRAAQLAYFSVMMKGRQYDSRFFRRGVQPHVYSVKQSNAIDKYAIDYFCNGDNRLKKAIETIIKELFDAKEYGSLISTTEQDWSILYHRFEEIENDISMYKDTALELKELVIIAEMLSKKYHVVVTNPPYMAMTSADSKLSDIVKTRYPDSKADLFAVFIERCSEMTKENGFQAMITMHAWMFLSSYEKLREKILRKTITDMIHLGARAFEEIAGEVVQTTGFVIRNASIPKYKGIYYRLVDESSQNAKEKAFIEESGKYTCEQEGFKRIQGAPIAYWASEQLLNDFEIGLNLKKYGDTRQGMATSDNNRFLRLWFEVDYTKIAFNCSNADAAKETKCKWFPYNKGGSFRKWYGNMDYVINYENDGYEVKEYATSLYKTPTRTIKSISEYFKPCLSWSKISTGNIAFRYYPSGFVFDVAGCCIFYKSEDKMLYDFGFINSSVAMSILSILAPTMNFEAGHVASLPVIENKAVEARVKELVQDNVKIAKEDWDSFETSWDFQRSPLIRDVTLIEDAFNIWAGECNDRIEQIKRNEEELNSIFAEIYGLTGQIEEKVDYNNISIRKADLIRDIKDFISYAIGCIFGRFSLERKGIAFAGGQWDSAKYSIEVDRDNIIPICDDEYFEDDIVGQFVRFVRTVYGEKTLAQNLQFIAKALGGNGQPADVIRNYFINDFYSDHCNKYSVTGSGKRPIYWLFDSGKKGGFKCLIYMHRYQPDTIARIRTDYVHEQQSRYRTAIADVENRMSNASTGEKVKLSKLLKQLNDQSEEIRLYEEKIHHLADQMIPLDLDEGLKKNYSLFADVLAKI